MIDLNGFIEHESGLFVSREGKVFVPKSKSHFEHLTYGNKIGNGYLQVAYKRKKYYVHRLVADVFIPNPEGKETVDHINMVKTDNRACNLRWATYKEQMNFDDQDVTERLVSKIDYESIIEKQRKKVLQLTIDGELVREWTSAHECSRNGYKQSAVCQCCNNKYSHEGNNIYKGYKWQYA